jgi:hypothetical protein
MKAVYSEYSKIVWGIGETREEALIDASKCLDDYYGKQSHLEKIQDAMGFTVFDVSEKIANLIRNENIFPYINEPGNWDIDNGTLALLME